MYSKIWAQVPFNSLKKKRYVLLIILTMVFIGTLLSGYCSAHQIEAQEAYFDLSEYDFESNGPVKLNGEWEFYWHQFPDIFNSNNKEQIEYREIPQNWEKYQKDAESLPLYGYATYRLRIRLADTDRIYALRINRVFTAYKLWIDGNLCAERGQIAADKENAQAKIMPATVFFKPQQSELELILQVSNYHYYQSGIVDAIELGTSEQMATENENKRLYDLLLAGIILGIGIYHLSLYFIFHKDASPFYFAILCFMVFLQIVFEGDMVFSSAFPAMNLQTEESLQTIEHFLISPAMIHMMYHMFNQKISRKALLFIDLSSIAAILALLAMPFEFLYPIWTLYSPIIIFNLIYILFFLLRGVLSGKKSSIIAFSGFLCFALTGIYDVLISLKIMSPPFLLPYGLLVFIFCQCWIIARKYSLAFNKIEILSEDLQESNKYLRQAYDKVEQQVLERTEELRKAKEEIEQMNYELVQDKIILEKELITDGLTKLYTREYACKKLTEAMQESTERRITLTVGMMDIDYFKNINDSYGHAAGDKVLEKLSQIMNEISRKSDIIARYGGEEFLLIMPETSLQEAYQYAERIRRAIEDHDWWLDGLKVTISGGLAECACSSQEELLQKADQLLYAAKNRGRNRIEK